MNNRRTAAVMFLMMAMLIGTIGIAPAIVRATASPLVATNPPTAADVLSDWVKFLDESRPSDKVSAVLRTYEKTGTVPRNVAVDPEGRPSVIIAISSKADIEGLSKVVKVNWMVDFGPATVVNAYVDRASLGRLESYEGVAAVVADYLFRERVEGIESRADLEFPVQTEPEMWMSNDYLGVNDMRADFGNFDGSGVRVGVVDTGVDFTHPDLWDAYYWDPFDGSPSSFDVGGYGMVSTLYRVNATPVANVSAYLAASSWNRLSYEKDGKIYINFEPRLHDRGSLNYLDQWYFETYLEAWWYDPETNEWLMPYVENVTDFYYSVLRAPMELPAPTTTYGASYSYSYKVNGTSVPQSIKMYNYGWLFQQRNSPYAKVFAPMLVLNGTKLVVDWNTARAYTTFWNYVIGGWRYGLPLFYFNDTATWAYFGAYADCSFVDDLANDEWYTHNGGLYGANRLILAHQYADSKLFGLGVIGNAWDPVFGIGMIYGRALGGRLWAVTYDTDAHGTFVTGQIAGRGTMQYGLGLNNALVTLPGIANGSKIIATTAIGVGSHFGANLWEAGFDFVPSTGYFVYNPKSNHSAVVSSNSWGWIMEQYGELYPLYSLMYAALSTPGYFGASYPGILYCFSAGNAGPGSATTTPPVNAYTLSVGAATSHHTFVNSYGDDQGWGQIAEFSSRGPIMSGYVKPDVVAPGRNIHGIIPWHGTFLGLGSSYATYAGTSMACPQVAGVVALMYQHTPTLRPDEAKVIVQSTAVDLGSDAIAQGHGMVNAYNAIAYLEGVSGVVFQNTDSVSNYAQTVSDAWSFWMNPYTQGDVFINSTSAPTGFMDSSLYFGIVNPGDSAQITMSGVFADGSPVQIGDVVYDSMGYRALATWTTTWATYTYLENTSNPSTPTRRGGWFVLSDEMGDSFNTLMNARYATLYFSAPQEMAGSWWVFIFDWSDTSPANGVPDYYNKNTGLGNELTRVQYGGDNYKFKTDLSSPTKIADLFPTGNPIVMVVDSPLSPTRTHNINVTIVVWELVSNGELQMTGAGSDLTVTLNVPADAEYGIHYGYLNITDASSSGMYSYRLIPYSYMVKATIDTTVGSMVIADGFGNFMEPYERGAAYEPMNAYYEQSGDHISFPVYVDDSNAHILAARLTWNTPNSDFDLWIVKSNGYELASSADAVGVTGSAAAIAQIPGTGLYFIHIVANDLGAQPTPFTLTVLCLEELPTPTVTFTWTGRTHTTPTVLNSGDSASDDHVVIKATWTDAAVAGLPEYVVTTTQLKILRGLYFTETGPLVIPVAGYNPFSGVVDLEQFAWVFVPGIEAGDNVRMTVDFTNGDCDIMAWWADTDNTTWTYSNNLLGSQMATGAHPEVGSFIASRSGTLAIGIFDYDRAPGTFTVTVDTRSGLEPAKVLGKAQQVDTYSLGANGSFDITAYAETGTNVKLSAQITGVGINNFFKPHLSNVVVTGAGAVKTITWDLYDLNADDTHVYSVHESHDGGVTWNLLAAGLTSKTYTWDSTPFYERLYMIQIRVTDSYGLTDEAESEPFTAGTVPLVPTIDIGTVMLGFFAGVGVGVVVVLILYLVKRR